jgi:hypothetical protein
VECSHYGLVASVAQPLTMRMEGLCRRLIRGWPWPGQQRREWLAIRSRVIKIVIATIITIGTVIMETLTTTVAITGEFTARISFFGEKILRMAGGGRFEHDVRIGHDWEVTSLGRPWACSGNW